MRSVLKGLTYLKLHVAEVKCYKFFTMNMCVSSVSSVFQTASSLSFSLEIMKPKVIYIFSLNMERFTVSR